MTTDAAGSEVLTLAEAARYIRVSRKTLREMARAHRIPSQKVGREWRFLCDALKEWLSGDAAVANPSRAPAAQSTYNPEAVAEPLVQYEIPFTGFRDTAFRDNYERALHRWVPWIAGFSASFVHGVIERLEYSSADEVTVLDPFAGVGTTLVEALKNGHNAVGFEINPYAVLACKAKIECRSYNVGVLQARINRFEEFMRTRLEKATARPESTPPQGFVSRVPFFSPGIERQVLFSLDFINQQNHSWVRDLFRVAFGSVMVGFSNYSYEPSLGTRLAAGKPNIEHADVRGILAGKLRQMAQDIGVLQRSVADGRAPAKAIVYSDSYFACRKRISPQSIDVLITSPPYLNNYHYIRNTRPQMFWLGMVKAPGDLKPMERNSFGQFWQTVRSGPPIELMTKNPELSQLIESLSRRRPEKGVYGGQGWANYATTYFNDCVKFCRITRSLMKPGGIVVVVIGNNILQGLEFRTDEFFAQIAEENGFEVMGLHEVRTKRTGSSIVNSSVRAGVVKKRTRLYETAVELRAP